MLFLADLGTFDLEHEVWLVSHEPYFNSAETR